MTQTRDYWETKPRPKQSSYPQDYTKPFLFEGEIKISWIIWPDVMLGERIWGNLRQVSIQWSCCGRCWRGHRSCICCCYRCLSIWGLYLSLPSQFDECLFWEIIKDIPNINVTFIESISISLGTQLENLEFVKDLKHLRCNNIGIREILVIDKVMSRGLEKLFRRLAR